MIELTLPITYCISLGQLHLSGSSETTDVQNKLKAVIEVSGQPVFPDLNTLTSRAEKAGSLLASRESLYLMPEDCRYARTSHRQDLKKNMPDGLAVNIALNCLDDLSYFCHGVELLEKAGLDFADEVTSVFDRLDKISYEDLPYHRLVPLNELRDNRLHNIKEEYRYLFPWYTSWVDLDSMFFSLLADEGELALDVEKAILDRLKHEYSLLTIALTNDEVFFDRILSEANVARHLPQALAEDKVYHLLRMADQIAEEISLPDVVIAAGREDAAVRVAVNAILKNITTQDWKIPAAVYGMEMSDEQRRTILESLQRKVPSCDNKKVRSLIKKMVSDLKKVAQQGFSPLPDPCSTYFELLQADDPQSIAEKIRRHDSQIEDILEAVRLRARIEAIWDNLKEGLRQENTGYAIAGSAGGDGEEGRESRIETFPLEDFPQHVLVMPPIREEADHRGRTQRFIPVLTEPEFSGPNGLKEKLKLFRDISWGGKIITQTEVKNIQMESGLPHRISMGEISECEAIVIAIYPDKQVISNALMFNEDAINKVGWIIYTNEFFSK